LAHAKPRGKYWYGYEPYTGNLGLISQLTKDEANIIASEREKRLNPQLPKKKFDIIYADPPWPMEKIN
jgi:16S rRNA G966 N2-methylase RsmD